MNFLLKKTVHSGKTEQGYVAVMSAIIISVLLLAITVSLGFCGFFARQNMLDTESKEQSSQLAQSCINVARLESASNVYSTNKTVQIKNVGACTIVSSKKDFPAQGQTLINTQAMMNKSYTNLQAIIDSNSFEIISRQECPTLDLCPLLNE